MAPRPPVIKSQIMTTKHLTNKSHALIRRRIAFFLIGSFALAASARQSQLPPNGDPPATNQPAADRASSAAIIPEVVVTATRTKEEVRNISQSITVLTHDDIERQQALTPNEMLMEQPGIWSVQVPAQGSPIIRGQIGNRVLYLWDGIPINTGAIFAGQRIFQPGPRRGGGPHGSHSRPRLRPVWQRRHRRRD